MNVGTGVDSIIVQVLMLDKWILEPPQAGKRRKRA
jgi:hypothetical protein